MPVKTRRFSFKHKLLPGHLDGDWRLLASFFSRQSPLNSHKESIRFFRLKFLVSVKLETCAETRNLSRKKRMLSQATKYQVLWENPLLSIKKTNQALRYPIGWKVGTRRAYNKRFMSQARGTRFLHKCFSSFMQAKALRTVTHSPWNTRKNTAFGGQGQLKHLTCAEGRDLSNYVRMSTIQLRRPEKRQNPHNVDPKIPMKSCSTAHFLPYRILRS